MVTEDDFEGSIADFERNRPFEVVFRGSIADFERYFANYKEKGFNEHAAQAMAVEAMEGGEKPQESVRFARIYG